MHLPPKFHRPMFTRSEVVALTNKQTNKQTPMKTSNALRYARTLDKYVNATKTANNQSERNKTPGCRAKLNPRAHALHSHLSDILGNRSHPNPLVTVRSVVLTQPNLNTLIVERGRVVVVV